MSEKENKENRAGLAIYSETTGVDIHSYCRASSRSTPAETCKYFKKGKHGGCVFLKQLEKLECSNRIAVDQRINDILHEIRWGD